MLVGWSGLGGDGDETEKSKKEFENGIGNIERKTYHGPGGSRTPPS